ncbi:MAG: SMC-Scp complex subunit ScpB [Pseudomonadota bacterium]
MNPDTLKRIVEAALLAAEQPLNLNQLSALFEEDEAPGHADLSQALEALSADCEDRGIELSRVASGYRLQVKADVQPWVSRLWAEKPPRYSRALLETLAIIAYRQPMTRAEIEQIRGVSVSSNIMRTLQEREWVRIVGHRDVPGRPALFGTTKRFLDYFDLASLDQLPSLAELKDLGELEPELALEIAELRDGAAQPTEENAAGSAEADDADIGEASAAAEDAEEHSEPRVAHNDDRMDDSSEPESLVEAAEDESHDGDEPPADDDDHTA